MAARAPPDDVDNVPLARDACSHEAAAAPDAAGMRLVGSDDLQARSAYQPTIHHQGDRWIAYIGLLVILYVSLDMIYRGSIEVWPHVSALL